MVHRDPKTQAAWNAYAESHGLKPTDRIEIEHSLLALPQQLPDVVALPVTRESPTVLNVQQALISKGFDTPVNGVFGPQTSAAMNAFVRSVGLTPAASKDEIERALFAPAQQQQQQPLPSNTSPVIHSPSDIVRIQKALNVKGFPGPVDGVIGAQTVSSLNAFLSSVGLSSLSGLPAIKKAIFARPVHQQVPNVRDQNAPMPSQQGQALQMQNVPSQAQTP